MRKREALKLNNGDEVWIKKTVAKSLGFDKRKMIAKVSQVHQKKERYTNKVNVYVGVVTEYGSYFLLSNKDIS